MMQYFVNGSIRKYSKALIEVEIITSCRLSNLIFNAAASDGISFYFCKQSMYGAQDVRRDRN